MQGNAGLVEMVLSTVVCTHAVREYRVVARAQAWSFQLPESTEVEVAESCGSESHKIETHEIRLDT